MTDIVEKLRDLHTQATTERSHYYVGSVCTEAIAEIESLRRIMKLSAGVSLQLVTEMLERRDAERRDERTGADHV